MSCLHAFSRVFGPAPFGSAGARSASSASSLRDSLQVEPFVEELLFLRFGERGEGSLVCEPVRGAGSPRAEDDERKTRLILVDAHRY